MNTMTLPRGAVLILAVTVLVVTAGVAGQQPPSQGSAELTAAAAAERSGNYEEAARDYRSFLSSAGSSAPSPVVIEARTHLATALFVLHRYAESLDAIEPLHFPSSTRSHLAAASIPAQAWLVRGLDCLELNQLPEAIRSLKEALALNPASGTAGLALGDALARSGQLEEAAEAYRRELRRAPGTIDGWFKLGSVYEELSGKLTAEFTQQQPNQILALQLSAEQSLDRGDYWGAAKALFPVMQRSSKSDRPGLHAAFGAALLQLGYPRAAEREFKAELLQNPDCLPAQLGMAEVEALRSNWNATLDTFGRLMALYPQGLARELESSPAAPLSDAVKKEQASLPPRLAGSPAGKLWNAWIGSNGLESPPRLDSAATACSPSPSRQEQIPGYWMPESCSTALQRDLRTRTRLTQSERAKLIETEYRLGDYEAASEGGRALLRESAHDPWAYYWLVKSYSALAGECFDKLAEASPDSARVHEILARYHSDRQQLAAARNEYEAALRLAPELPDLHVGLGTVYWQSGDWARAEVELSKALELSPGSAVAAYELGDCFVQQHQWQQAAGPLERALADPAVERRARLDLAKVEAELGQSEAAIKNLIILAPTDSDGEVHYRLAMIYRKVGDSAKADEALAQSEALRRSSDQLSQRQIEALEQEGANGQSAEPPTVAPK